MTMKILHNIPLKLLALFFAILLWIHVATNQRYDLEVQYRLAYVNVPDSLMFTETPTTTIHAFMRGSGKGLIRLLWSERRWPIDMTRSKAGTHKIHLATDNIPVYGIQGLEALGLLDSDTITVVLDSVGHRTPPAQTGDTLPAVGVVVFSRTPAHGRVFVTADFTTFRPQQNRLMARAVASSPPGALKPSPHSVTVVSNEQSRADTGG